MEIRELGLRVDALEAQTTLARARLHEAQRIMHVTDLPAHATDLNGWRDYHAKVGEVVTAAEALRDVELRLTAMAELEQALKEERWGDASHWSAEVAAQEAAGNGVGTERLLKLTHATEPSAGRCATDLRNRGLQVEQSTVDDRVLLVRQPAGWTGTPAADVARAHDVRAVSSVAKPVGDVVFD